MLPTSKSIDFNYNFIHYKKLYTIHLIVFKIMPKPIHMLFKL